MKCKWDFSARQYHSSSNSSTSYIIAKVVQKHDFACLGAELFHVLQLNNVIDTLTVRMSPEKFVFIVWFIGTLEAIKEASAAGEKSAYTI